MSRFQAELDKIQRAQEILEGLYDETKEHFDAIKKSNSRNTLSFIHLQTGNLTALMNAQLSAAKDSFNIKKVEAELELKSKQATVNSDHEEMLKELYEKMMNDTTIIPTEDKEVYEDEYEDYDVDSELDAIADKFEKEGQIEYNNELEEEGYGTKENPIRNEETDDGEEEQQEYDDEEYEDDEYEDEYEEFQPQEALIVVILNGKKWSFGAINEDEEELDDVELPDKKDYKMKLKKVDGEIIAYDQNEKIYRVIKKQ